MSLDQSIADLISQAGQLLNLPQTIADEANSKIDSLTDRYKGILDSQTVELWVDQTNGLDTNAGTEASPLKEMQKAIDMAPFGGKVHINLVGDYEIKADISTGARSVMIRGQSGIKPSLTTQRYTSGSSPVYRAIRAFRISALGALFIYNVKIHIPDLSGYETTTISNTGFFSSDDDWGLLQVNIRNCEISIPASPFCYMFPSAQTWRFLSYANTYPGAITNPLGRLFYQQANTSGVASKDIPWIITNLATI